MTVARVYVESATLPQGRLRLEGSEHHHLSRVLRMRKGQAVLVFDGRGSAARASISEISSAFTVLEVGEVRKILEEKPRLHLFQAIPRKTKMDTVVQYGVELGAASINPFASERSCMVDRAVTGRMERWRKIALESSRVAGRAYLPRVESPLSWEGALEALRGLGRVLFADEKGGARTVDSLPEEAPDDLGLVVGPEGGFSDAEREQLSRNGAGAVTLGDTVLRTETAGMVLLAAVKFRYGTL